MGKIYTYNSEYLMENGKPCFPVMGEIHYSRYCEDFWEESLRKMKAGGVTIVSTYVFWIHHEEEEGIFDFTGCRNLRKFVECCHKVGIKLFLRIGPWVHGECRNGGFPDWIVDLRKQGVKIRTNDETYMFYVKRYWEKLFEQVKGLLEEDGGPIVGIQLENEYWVMDKDVNLAGDAHMRVLMKMAKEIGFEVSLYTATGWGNTSIGDALPVMGGYCDAPWEQHVEELPANNNFVISHIRNDSLIASDHERKNYGKYDESKFPFLTAELGGGIQVTAHRRPVATGKDIGSMSHTKLASGVAMLGYYMYHGGSNPKGKLSTLQEGRDTAYVNYNDLPEINYDFNAPVRQYGTISDSYKEIKLLALFLQDFGEDLAKLPAEIEPEDVKPEDMHTLRQSCRHDDTHGYIFFNNYVRRRTMDAHEKVVFRGRTAFGDVMFPPVDIESGTYGFFPYNMELGDAVLETALATPLCKLDCGDKEIFVFYGDYEPQYRWKNGESVEVLHLTRQQALNAYKVKLDKDYLILNDNFVWEQDGELVVVGPNTTTIRTFPELPVAPKGFERIKMEGVFTVYGRNVDLQQAAVSVAKQSEDDENAVYVLDISYGGYAGEVQGNIHRDIFLWIDYVGYSMDIYCGDNKINDHFYTGQLVPIRLKYFDFPEKLMVKIKALKKDDWVYLEKWPDLLDGRACKLNAVTVSEEYR